MKRKHIVWSVVCIALLSLIATPAVAQNKAGYYENNSTSTGSGAWLSGLTDGELSDIIALAMRTGGFLIGDGAAQGGVGSAGSLLTGLLVAGVMGGIGMRSGAGAAGGSVIAVAAASVFVTASIGAQWAFAVVLFVVGLIVSMVFLRILR